MLKFVAAAAAATALLGLGACGQQSAEKAGEDIDNQIEETFQGERDLGDGPFERAGEAVDNATGTQRTDSPADAINDAVEDNTNR